MPKPKADKPDFSLKPEALKRKPELTGGKIEEIAVKGATIAINDPRLGEMEKNEAAELQRTMIASLQALPGMTQPQAQVNRQPDPPPETFTPPPRGQIQQIALPSPLPQQTAPMKIFFTGRLGIGKDFCAAKAGYTIVGFADPMYSLANHFFGTSVSATEGKDAPGMRAFLQTVGQWGRNEVNAQYPYSPLRAIFITMIRSLSAAGALPDSRAWEKFGTDKNFWVDRLLARTANAPGRLAVTNCRFENEFSTLKANGWQHWHLIASPNTWQSRLQSKNLSAQSPEVNDMSEALAKKLDASVVKTLSTHRNGEKLRVVWNDTAAACPSKRIHTLEEFLALSNQ